jgi:hypothetical protein
MLNNAKVLEGQWPCEYLHQLSDNRDTLMTLRHPTQQLTTQCL